MRFAEEWIDVGRTQILISIKKWFKVWLFAAWKMKIILLTVGMQDQSVMSINGAFLRMVWISCGEKNKFGGELRARIRCLITEEFNNCSLDQVRWKQGTPQKVVGRSLVDERKKKECKAGFTVQITHWLSVMSTLLTHIRRPVRVLSWSVHVFWHGECQSLGVRCVPS
jgi:hypothetical protein